jgi:hypothetical protein
VIDVLDVRPGAGIGPIDIGMSRADAIEAATLAGLIVEPGTSGTVDGPPDLMIRGQLLAYFDADDFVAEVEVAIPSGNTDELPVTCLNLDLTASFETVLRHMASIAQVDKTKPEYPGTSVFRELGLSLWADARAEDLPDVCVEAILVRRARFN